MLQAIRCKCIEHQLGLLIIGNAACLLLQELETAQQFFLVSAASRQSATAWLVQYKCQAHSWLMTHFLYIWQ